MAIKAGVGTVEEVHEEHVGVPIPVSDVSESDGRANYCLSVEAGQIVDLPRVRSVMIQIELVRTSLVITFVQVVSAAVVVTGGRR
jgi:hypothetical protein